MTTARHVLDDQSFEARRWFARGCALRPRTERARATDDARALGRLNEVIVKKHFLFSVKSRVFGRDANSMRFPLPAS